MPPEPSPPPCRRWWLPLLALAVLTSLAWADRIVLKDGSVLQGQIVEERSEHVVIQTEEGKKLVPRRQIREILRQEAEPSAELAPQPDPPAPPDLPASEAPEEPAPPPAEEVPSNLVVSQDLPKSFLSYYSQGADLVTRAQAADDPSERGVLAKASLEPLDRARKKCPRQPQPLYQLGIAYQLLNDDETARGHLEKALRLEPDFYEAMVELGDIVDRMEGMEPALDLYSRAVELNPSYAPGWRQRGMGNLKLRNLEQAKTDLEKARELDGEDRFTKRLADMVEAEAKVLEGWENTYTAETEHYTVTTSVSQEFADKIAATAEEAYGIYDILFAAKESRRSKFPIIVFSSAKEYVEAGSPPGSGGYYNSFLKKLVLFQYKEWGDTLNVINHEGFHQYLDMYLRNAPQWFNEGHGDLFGFSSRKGDELQLRPNAWRLDAIQKALQAHRIQPLPRLLTMSQRELYNPRTVGTNYAQSWSFVFFLWTYNNGQYRSVLKNYFLVLRKGADLKEAYQATFGKLPMDQIESQWKQYTEKLELFPEDAEMLRRKKGQKGG